MYRHSGFTLIMSLCYLPETSDESDETEQGFRLVNEQGETPQPGEWALLLYNGGTVCDDDFGLTEAQVICKELGFGSVFDQKSGDLFGIQADLSINLDDVDCSEGSSWSDCDFTTTHNCQHSEDVFLICTGKLTYNDLNDPFLLFSFIKSQI